MIQSLVAVCLGAFASGSQEAPAPQDAATSDESAAADELQPDDLHTDLDALADEELRKRDAPAEKLTTEERNRVRWILFEWGGGRRWLEERGLRIAMLYTADGSLALDGGADPGGAALHGLLDLIFTYDTEPVLGWHGGTFHVGVQWGMGVDASQRYGLVQAFSNIDAEERFQVSRVWYEQYFSETRTRLRIGKIDANSLFAFVDNGAQFLNSSMGVSPTIFLMPTYPDPSFGAALVQGVGSHVRLRGGVFDGSGARGVRTGSAGPGPLFTSTDDLFLIAEAELVWSDAHRGRLAAGGWKHTGDLARFDGGSADGTDGTYVVLEQRLVNHDHSEEAGLDAFAQLDWADGAVSPVDSHFGAGLVCVDPLGARDDYLGFGVTRAGLSSAPGAGYTTSGETALELFYGFGPAPWVRVKPDLQYVIDPGGDASLDDAWILTLRATVSL